MLHLLDRFIIKGIIFVGSRIVLSQSFCFHLFRKYGKGEIVETKKSALTKYLICCLMSLIVFGAMMGVTGASDTSESSYNPSEALDK